MDLSKEQILQIIEFIIDDDDLSPDKFLRFASESNHWGIDGFKKNIRTTIRVFNLDDDDIDFIYHVYYDNNDLLLKDNLTVDNMVIPIKKNYQFTTKCLVSKSGFEYYEYNQKLYSEKSIYWLYDQGDFYPNDGKLVDEDESMYEMLEWEIEDFNVLSGNNVKESKEDRLKKLLMMKEIVDRKIKELI
jgi:hypothetical protein